MTKRWMQYKVCYLDEDGKEQTLFVTTEYLKASQFASQSDLQVNEVYIKSVWKLDLPPRPPVERITVEEKKDGEPERVPSENG